MSAQSEAIAPGFGARLREERTRLGLNQTEFAQRADIQRIAQSQYELEARAPNIRYLSAIGSAGVNLYYLLFGKTSAIGALPQAEQRRIEQQVFELIEDYARVQCGGQLSAEGRFVLFEVMRAHLAQVALGGSGQEMNIMELVSAREKQNEPSRA